MSLLPAVGTVSYGNPSIGQGNFDFPTAINSSIQVRPVYDSANRTIKYRTYNLTIHFTVTAADLSQLVSGGLAADANIDLGIRQLRRILETPGLDLYFENQGFGILHVNKANAIGYGPLPGKFSWEPLGSNKAARIVWSVEFSIVECTLESSATGIFGELTYSIDWEIDSGGMTTRTISGKAEAWPRRVEHFAKITTSADRLWDLLRFPLISNYKRTYSHNLSPDRAVITFTITDTEIPSDNPYPVGIVNIDMRQRVSGGWAPGAGNLVNWNLSFDATIEVAPGKPRYLAWQAFLMVLSSRLTSYPSETKFINARLEFGEDIFKRTVTFGVSYILRELSLAKIVQVSGLWRPVPSVSWDTWIISMEDVMTPRGISKLQFDANTDRIIDYCYSGPVPPIGNVSTKPPAPYQPALLTSSCPDEAHSWWSWINEFEYSHEPDNIYFATPTIDDSETPSQNQLTETPPDPELGGEGTSELKGIHFEVTGPTSTIVRSQAYVQDRYGRLYLILHGYCVRIGWKIQKIPYVYSIDGKRAVLSHPETVSNKRVGTLGDCPVYAASWRKVYYAGGTGGNIIMKNVPPEFQTEAKKTALRSSRPSLIT